MVMCIDPMAVMARREGILTDRAYDEARARPRCTPTKTLELLPRLSGPARRVAAENRRLCCWWAL